MSSTVALLVSASSHPEFDLFASLDFYGRQHWTRGSRTEIDAWVAQLIAAGQRHGITVTIIDHTS